MPSSQPAPPNRLLQALLRHCRALHARADTVNLPVAASSLAMLLGFRGHDTRVACSGREALEHVESFRPEVVLLDIGLPETSGYELALRLRAAPQLHGVRLIALTGYGQPEDQQRALAAGFDGHLVKPVSLAALERALAVG